MRHVLETLKEIGPTTMASCKSTAPPEDMHPGVLTEIDSTYFKKISKQVSSSCICLKDLVWASTPIKVIGSDTIIGTEKHTEDQFLKSEIGLRGECMPPFSQQEKNQVIEKYKGEGEEKLTEALCHLYRDQSFQSLLNTSRGITEKIKPSEELESIDILVHLQLIETRVNHFIGRLRECLEFTSDKLDQNPYGIKDFLDYLSQNVDIGTEGHFSFAQLRLFQGDGSYIYNNTDVQESRDQGYEEGYEACLRANQTRKISTRLDKVDLK